MIGIQTEKTKLTTLDGYDWFFIMCSWEQPDDREAMDKWIEVYNFFIRAPADPTKVYNARDDIADQGLIALNLIGKRKFVIAGQTRSNKALQEISSMITLQSPIKVDVFAATNVYDFGLINQERIGFDANTATGALKARN